jgi:hypothetical protein
MDNSFGDDSGRLHVCLRLEHCHHALPYISKDLSADYSLLGWVLAGFVLAVAALIL